MFRILGAAALAAIAAGCGGGGGDAPALPSPPPLASAPVQPVLLAVAGTSSTYTATGANGLSFTLTIAPGSSAQFTSYEATAVVRQNGAITNTSSYGVIYTASPFKILGVQIAGNSGPINWVANQTAAIPDSAATLASGMIFSAPTPPSTVGVGPLSATWSVEADSATTAFTCINTTRDSGLVTTVHSVESDCFKVNAAGAILGFKATLVTDGVASTFK